MNKGGPWFFCEFRKFVWLILCKEFDKSSSFQDNHLVLVFHFTITFADEICLFLFSGFNTEVAMKKAMHNVEKSYAVVGVLEELNKTLTVLEHYVPRFFKGAKDLYYSKLELIY